jgi:hypothetical protein
VGGQTIFVLIQQSCYEAFEATILMLAFTSITVSVKIRGAVGPPSLKYRESDNKWHQTKHDEQPEKQEESSLVRGVDEHGKDQSTCDAGSCPRKHLFHIR